MKKFAKKVLAGTLSLAMVLGMIAVVNPETASAKKVTVKKVTVAAPSGKTAYVAKGKKVKLTATVKVTPNKKANKKVTYKSANKKVATVNSKGQIKGVKAGQTKITVVSKKNKKKKATIKVVVKKAAVKKVKLNATKASLAVGGKKTLKATVTPKKNTSSKIVWSSSKKKVATVSSKGVVKGKAEGSATITAKAADGSGKKATCKVTVGAGINAVTVPHSSIVRVSLTGAKALTAANFTVQSKSVESRKYIKTNEVEQVRALDGGKTYDVILDDSISENTYVKVSINALKGENSKEIFVEGIAGYGYGEDAIERIEGMQSQEYWDTWSISGVDSVGTMKYTVTGLPAGLKAYMNKDQTSVRVRGTYANVENGTTATLIGVDEKGKTFKKSYVFYVGNKKTIVGNVLNKTVLSYVLDNPNTQLDEESGYDFLDDRTEIVDEWACISGGSDSSYEYSVTGLPAAVDSMSIEGRLQSTVVDEDGDYVKAAIPAGVYNVVLTVKDANDAAVSAQFPFTITVTDGVTVTGTVKDASGAPMKYTQVYGATRMNAYGRSNSFSVDTKADGTYTARVIPGDYYTVANGGYDLSVGNMFAASTVKDFTVPLYKVNFTTTIPGATAYRKSRSPYFIDAQGRFYEIERDSDDYTLYAYLRAGSYEMRASAGSVDPAIDSSYNNTIYAYSKYSTFPYLDGVRAYLSDSDQIGERPWQVTCAPFTVAGAMNVQLTATILP